MGTDVKVGADIQVITSAEQNSTLDFTDSAAFGGDTPHGMVAFGNSSASHETANAHVSWSHGGTDGTAEGSIGFTDTDNVSSHDSSENMNITRPAIILSEGHNALDNGLDHNSFIANGWRTDTVTTVGKTATFIAVMFEGADCKVKHLQVTKSTDPTTPGYVTCTHSLGTSYPNLLVFVGMNFETSNTNSVNKSMGSYGLVSIIDSTGTPTVVQRCYDWASDHASSAADQKALISTSYCAMNTTAGVTTHPFQACSVITTGMDANSFRLQTDLGSQAQLINLTVVGLSADITPWVGTVDSWATGADRTPTLTPSISFTPQVFGICGGTMSAVDTDKANSDSNSHFIGVACASGEEMSIHMYRDSTPASVTQTETYHSNDSFVYYTQKALGVVGHSQNPTFNSSGFTVSSGDITAGRTGDKWIGWAIEEQPAAAGKAYPTQFLHQQIMGG